MAQRVRFSVVLPNNDFAPARDSTLLTAGALERFGREVPPHIV